jgi:phage-related holin
MKSPAPCLAVLFFILKKEGVNVKASLASYTFVGALGGGIQAVFTTLYGHGEIRFLMFILFFLLLVIDFAAGTSASDKDGSYGSIYGRKGGLRLAVYLLIPALGNLIDVVLNIKEPFIVYGYEVPGFAFGFLIFTFGLHIAKSAVANVYRAGWNPPQLWVRWAKNEIELKEARATERRLEKQRLLKLKERSGLDA